VEREVTLEEVRTFETRGGNARYVVRDSEGNEYTTFREAIGEKAQQLEGRRARIEFHTEQRGEYTNVYLDRIEPLGEGSDGKEGAEGSERTEATPDADTDPEEAAWRTAVEAAPWLVGGPDKQIPPEKLYEKLKPFEERVAEDIKKSKAKDG
jgi:hypothetical protein